jgi:hypothetical protein
MVKLAGRIAQAGGRSRPFGRVRLQKWYPRTAALVYRILKFATLDP